MNEGNSDDKERAAGIGPSGWANFVLPFQSFLFIFADISNETPLSEWARTIFLNRKNQKGNINPKLTAGSEGQSE